MKDSELLVQFCENLRCESKVERENRGSLQWIEHFEFDRMERWMEYEIF